MKVLRFWHCLDAIACHTKFIEKRWQGKGLKRTMGLLNLNLSLNICNAREGINCYAKIILETVSEERTKTPWNIKE